METKLEDIDAARLQLEKNVKALQEQLKHWQIEEAEYEGLKEELARLNDDAPEQKIRNAAVTSQGHSWNTADLKTILESNGHPRKPSQIINLLERRIDYVQQNVKSTEKRLATEQEKLDQANFLGHRDEGGLPLMEITEELDEDDNVISSSLIKPGEAAPKLLDMLQENGVEDDTLSDAMETENQETPAEKEDLVASAHTSTIPARKKSVTFSDTPLVKENPSQATDTAAPETTPPVPTRRKSVTFSDIPQVREIDSSMLDPPRRFATGIDVSESQPVEDPVIPADESEQDSALRRQMLEYNMRDIGTIVAEMDMEDGESDVDEDDEEDYDSEEESEDEYGRTTRQVVSETYRQKMLELEKKLNAKAIVNVGPKVPGVVEKELQMESDSKEETSVVESETPAVEKDIPVIKNDENAKPSRKGVRFAPELDIQDAPPRPISKLQDNDEIREPKPVVNPMSDLIVERAPVSEATSAQAKKRVSKFKAARQETNNKPSGRYEDGDNLYPAEALPSRTNPSGRPTSNSTISENILERESKDDNIRNPDILDPELHKAEVRNAYHQMRNDMIQRENGFMEQDMEEFEDDSGRPTMSRFKAARIARQKMEQGDI